MSARPVPPSRRDDRGSLSIEYAVLAPVVFLILALIFVYGRSADVDGNLQAGTRDAARVATEAPDADTAKNAARAAIEQAMGSLCSTLTVDFPNAYGPGDIFVVSSRCVYKISDLGLPGAPGSLTATSSFASIVDPNRTIG